MYALISLSVLSVLTLLSGLFHLRKLVVPLAVVGLLAAIGLMASDWNTSVRWYNDMAFFDNYAIAFSILVCSITILITTLFINYKEHIDVPLAEGVSLMLFTVIGAITMVSFSNLTMLFIGIEILSISLYILAGTKKRDFFSNEAALKYFLMGAFATGFLLFGIALIYGTTGSFNVVAIKNFVSANKEQLPPVFYGGLFMMLVGMSFKISAVPFQFWTPDVYQGSPSIVTVFMATVVKTAGVAALYRLFSNAFGDLNLIWNTTMMGISALTMLVGNISAVKQSSFKRMLAYSSIAHAGYFLLAVFSATPDSSGAILVYAAAYSLATIAAVIGLMIIQAGTGTEEISSFDGLAKKNPFLAFTITVAMLSLAGIPPAAGFFAKFYIFSTAISQNYIWMVVVAILSSCIGIYYYFKVIIAMYMRPSESDYTVELSQNQQFVLMTCLVLTLALGIFPNVLAGLL